MSFRSGRIPTVFTVLGAIVLTPASARAQTIGYAFIPNELDNTVTIYTTETVGLPIARIVGAGPVGAATSPDGRYVFGSGTVSVIDAFQQVVEPATIPVCGAPGVIALTPDGRRALIACGLEARVNVVELTASPPTVTSLAVGSPGGVVVAPDGHRAYVFNYLTDSVTPIDLDSPDFTPLRPFNVGDGPGRLTDTPTAMAISPDGRFMVVVNTGSDSASIVNLPAGHGRDAICRGQQSEWRGVHARRPGVDHDVLEVGDIDLTNLQLQVVNGPLFAPDPGQTFVIIPHARGQFDRLAEGDRLRTSNAWYSITYRAGTRRDGVALTTVDAPPFITAPVLTDRAIKRNTVLGPIALTLSDDLTPAADLDLSVFSSKQSVIPTAAITLSGSGAMRSLQMAPVVNAIGSTTITLIPDGQQQLHAGVLLRRHGDGSAASSTTTASAADAELLPG